MRIAEARFAIRRLDEQKAFYGGIPSVAAHDGRMAVFGGGTSGLVFVRAEGGDVACDHVVANG